MIVITAPILLIFALVLVNMLGLLLLLLRRRGDLFLTISLWFFNIGILSWQISLIQINLIGDTRFAHEAAFVAALFALLGGVGLGLTYPDKKLQFPYRVVVALLTCVNLVLAYLVFNTNLVISNYVVAEQNVIFGPLGYLMTGLIAVELLVLVVTFAVRYRREERERYYFKYVFVAFVFYGVVAAVLNFLLPFIGGVKEFTMEGALLALIPQATILYTVVTQRIHDLRFIISRALYVILSGVLIWIGLFVFLWWGGVINPVTFVRSSSFTWGIVFSSGLSLLLLFLNRYLVHIVPTAVSRYSEGTQDKLKNFSRDVSTQLQIHNVVNEFLSVLQNVFDLEFVIGQVRDDTGSVRYESTNNQGWQSMHWDKFFELFGGMAVNQVFLRGDIIQKAVERVSDDELDLVLSDSNFRVVISTGVGDKNNGVFFLGSKKNKVPYTVQDVELLETLTNRVSLAIARSLLHEEVLTFSQKLQERVRVATQDLELRNRRLTVLRRLDQIILNTLDIRDMAQKIVDLVSWDMAMQGAVMVFLEDENGQQYLRVGALSATPIFSKALELLPQSVYDYRLPFELDPSNLFYRAIKDRRPYATRDLKDLYSPPLPGALVDTLQKATHSEYVVVYPLSAKGNPLGAISFGLTKPFEKLSVDERELLEAFMDEAGIAIENARLYDQLSERNEQMRQANLRLRELDRMKDELVSIASHELRTPMTAIKSYLWMALNKEGKQLNDNLKRYLERAYISSDRMIDLVNDMLSASRLEGKRIDLNIKAMDIRPVIRDVVAELTPRATEKGLQIEFKELAGELPTVLVDQDRFTEVMYNLVGNSIKYTDHGEITVGMEVKPNISPDVKADKPLHAAYLWIYIQDTGRGIAEEDLPRLFKKFGKLEQGSFTKTAETGGTGLGLYITKGLVELHEGKIWLESHEGQGSKFIFSLPVGDELA